MYQTRSNSSPVERALQDVVVVGRDDQWIQRRLSLTYVLRQHRRADRCSSVGSSVDVEYLVPVSRYSRRVAFRRRQILRDTRQIVHVRAEVSARLRQVVTPSSPPLGMRSPNRNCPRLCPHTLTPAPRNGIQRAVTNEARHVVEVSFHYGRHRRLLAPHRKGCRRFVRPPPPTVPTRILSAYYALHEFLLGRRRRGRTPPATPAR